MEAGANPTISGDEQGSPLEVVTSLGEYQYEQVSSPSLATKPLGLGLGSSPPWGGEPNPKPGSGSE